MPRLGTTKCITPILGTWHAQKADCFQYILTKPILLRLSETLKAVRAAELLHSQFVAYPVCFTRSNQCLQSETCHSISCTGVSMQDDESQRQVIIQEHDAGMQNLAALAHNVNFLSCAIGMQKKPEFRREKQSRLQLRLLHLWMGVHLHLCGVNCT